MNAIEARLGCPRPLLGMVHLLPLPGSPHARSMHEILERARQDTEVWFAGGADGVLVENFGDRPFFKERVPPITVAAMSRALEVVTARARGPVGVNVLRNDAEAALSLAAAHGLAFLRVNVHAGAAVTDQGLIEGRAAQTLRLRAQLPGDPLLLADLHVKHSAPLASRGMVEDARDLVERGGADGVILTGQATGGAPDLADLETLHAALADTPLLLGSGVTPELLARSHPRASGWIVGTWAKVGSDPAQPPDPSRVLELARARDRGA